MISSALAENGSATKINCGYMNFSFRNMDEFNEKQNNSKEVILVDLEAENKHKKGEGN